MWIKFSLLVEFDEIIDYFLPKFVESNFQIFVGLLKDMYILYVVWLKKSIQLVDLNYFILDYFEFMFENNIPHYLQSKWLTNE